MVEKRHSGAFSLGSRCKVAINSYDEYLDKTGTASFRRAFKVDDNVILVSISYNGDVRWNSKVALDPSYVQQLINIMVHRFEFPNDQLEHIFPQTLDLFRRNSFLVHVRSFNLFEAMAKAIIRQVITSKQAQEQIRKFINIFGKQYKFDGQIYYSFPEPQDIYEMKIEELLKSGIGFKAKAIHRIASNLLDLNVQRGIFSESNAYCLEELQKFDGIGDWSSRIILSDLTGDWSLYPHDDMALRYYANKHFPNIDWPKPSKDFKWAWNNYTNPFISVLTFYTLHVEALKIQ